MDDEYWAAYRRRLRERAARQGFLLFIGPVIIVGAVLGIVAPIDHPPSDIRGDLAFRVATLGLLITFASLGMVASARWLLRDRHR